MTDSRERVVPCKFSKHTPRAGNRTPAATFRSQPGPGAEGSDYFAGAFPGFGPVHVQAWMSQPAASFFRA